MLFIEARYAMFCADTEWYIDLSPSPLTAQEVTKYLADVL